MALKNWISPSLAGAALGALTLVTTPGCFDFSNVTNAEMRAALEELVADGQVLAFENEIVEITTSFTIGQGVEAVAEEIRTFVESQLPCSTVTLEGTSLEMDFGTLDDACTYNGHTFAGVINIELSADGDAIIVDHTFSEMTNGTVTLNGDKRFVWTTESRAITTDYHWATDEREIDATSNRTQTLLDESAGLLGGIVIDGERRWTGESGDWDLQIDGVEVRWLDPIPQAGIYSLTIPSNKVLSLSFSRVDEDTIEAVISGARRDRVFHITSSGAVSDQGDA